jgi:hypothetical protein
MITSYFLYLINDEVATLGEDADHRHDDRPEEEYDDDDTS